jgi:hypothetical protein
VLRLDHWNIILRQTTPDVDEAHASIDWVDEHFTANLFLQAGWQALTPRQKRNTLVHEMLHLYHREVDLLWHQCTQDNSAISAGDSLAWDADYKIQTERVISNFARIAERLCPDWDSIDKSWPVSPDVYVFEDPPE